MSDVPEEPTGDEFAIDPAFPEDHEPEARVSRPITARRVALASARTVAGLIGVGAAVVVVAAAVVLPLPTVGSVAPSQLVTPVPTAQQLVCPGAVLRLADDSGAGATTASAIDRPTVRFGANANRADSTPLGFSDASTGGTSAAPTVISTPPDASDPDEQVLLSGAQVQEVAEGEFVGLAAAECSPASGESWLVGGATTTGRTTLISLSNPSEVASTVTLEIFGENGPITAPGTTGIIVPPDGQRVLSLAGFQPDIASPVIHVTSTGGQIAASLQQSIVRGLEPGGLEIVGSIAAPSTSSVIPGVLVTGLEAVQALRGGGAGDFDDIVTAIRVLVPGEGSASLTVSVTPEDGATMGESFELEVDAGEVVELPLEELATGSYTVRVDSTEPAIVAARTTSALERATDFAWFTPAPALDGAAQLTVAPGPSPVLHLANPGARAVEVTLTGPEGEGTLVSVPSGSATALVVAPGTWSLVSDAPVHAAVTYAAGGMIGHTVALPPGLGSTPVVVYP